MTDQIQILEQRFDALGFRVGGNNLLDLQPLKWNAAEPKRPWTQTRRPKLVKGKRKSAVPDPSILSPPSAVRVRDESPIDFESDVCHGLPQNSRSSESSDHIPPTPAQSGHRLSLLPENPLASSIPLSLIRFAKEQRQAQELTSRATTSSSDRTVATHAHDQLESQCLLSNTLASGDVLQNGEAGSTMGSSTSTTTTTTKTTWVTWGTLKEPRPDGGTVEDTLTEAEFNEVDLVPFSVDGHPSAKRGTSPVYGAAQEPSLSNAHEDELEEFELERRCEMISKLYEALGKMEIELEKRVSQLRKASRKTATGRVKCEK
jgi:hypothetical protein